MATRLTWLGKAADRIGRERMPELGRELRAVFPEALGITIYDCFSGYTQDQQRKVALGVEVRSRGAYHTHVVKLGARDAVAADYEGWHRCILRHNVASRIFVSLDKHDLPGDRMAIIYEDAFRLFGTAENTQGPQPLETVAFWSIRDDKPDPLSVERVIRQIYTDLFRWFYRSPRCSERQAVAFYRRRLRRALPKWEHERWRHELRRDLIWQFCGHDAPGAFRGVRYLDPYDYVTWALRGGAIPQTLVGRAHGDLHGRNILVGVQRGEAEYPAVFDYGEMNESNVLAWDFVKLECELKVRLLLPLYDDAEARAALFGMQSPEGGPWPSIPDRTDEPSATVSARSLRAHQMAFAFRFESILGALTGRIHRLADPELAEPPGGRKITGHRALDRALGILLRVRQEAALFLGEGQPQRGSRTLWQDEYFFALAVYGLASAKFNYKVCEAAFALVSAGVAVAHMEQARHEIATQMQARPAKREEANLRRRYPSYHIPLAHAHHAWKGRRTTRKLSEALSVLRAAEHQFSHAVPLQQEYVLLLAEGGRYREALRLLAPLEDICRVYRDEETLCRVGRMCKDLGDRALAAAPVAARALASHPAQQWYLAGLTRYRDAYSLRESYYPGINAATLARLVGLSAESQRLAAAVIETCKKLDLSAMHVEDCFWVLASRAEASILLGQREVAAESYREALGLLDPSHAGMAQSAFNQVCRLRWALGDVTDEAIAAFHRSTFPMRPGPFCMMSDQIAGCPGLCSEMRRRARRQRAASRTQRSV